MASTEVGAGAAGRQLPAWARVTPSRRAHIGRVATLLERWAELAGVDEAERRRWVAAGWLHDALRDAPPDELRGQVPPALRDLPDRLLHGPACSERLRRQGVRDEGLLDAVAYHTIGHPRLEAVGRALMLADFLEPGRPHQPVWRASLRARMPGAMDPVLREVLAARIRHRLDRGDPVRPETLGLWNVLVAGAPE